MKKLSVLMVCTANICRSPMAAGLLLHQLKQQGLVKQVRVDSAGIRAIKGYRPDPRAREAVKKVGVDIGSMRARSIKNEDYSTFDLILCMDQGHYAALQEQCPEEHRHKIMLIMDFAPQHDQREVPDPYFGNASGFERVLGLLEAANHGVVKRLREEFTV
jgi:protein-tyrosine phosphatase